MPENRTRTFTLDRKVAKGDVFPAVAATEAPVKRNFGWEILDLARMDLSRAPLPVIESHDQSTLNIGVFEDVHIAADKLRGSIRLGKTARAREIGEDIKAGIVRSVSVGYEAFDPIESGEVDGLPVYRFASQIHELSLVAAPADTNSGIYRSHGKITMENLNRDTPFSATEATRIATIETLAEKYQLPDLGKRAIAAGDDVATFNTAALKAIDEEREDSRHETQRSNPQRTHTPNHYMGMPCDNSKYARAMEGYSIVKVLRGISDPRQLAEAGLEMEISQDMQRVLGKRSKGVMVPWEALQTRAMTAGNANGASVVADDLRAGDFIDVLRNASHVMRLNPTILRGLVGDTVIPRKSAGATAYWFGADDADSITESDLTLEQVGLSPKTCGGAVTFSHKLMIQSSPDIEGLVRQDLADLIAGEIDLKALNGSGASSQPLGVLNTTGIGAIDFVADDPTYAEIVSMETTLAEANADMGNLAWLMNPGLAEALRTTPKQGSGVEGNFIWGNDGRICNIPAHRTKNMPGGYLLLGNWQHLLVGFWGGIEIDADPYGSNFLKGSITVRVLADVDIGVRHPGAFCEGHNA